MTVYGSVGSGSSAVKLGGCLCSPACVVILACSFGAWFFDCSATLTVSSIFTAKMAFSLGVFLLCAICGVLIQQASVEYIYQKGPETFNVAQETCIKLGAILVSFHNDLEYQAVLEEISKNNGGAIVDTWIGLKDTIQEGTFVWTDGTPYGIPDDRSAFERFRVRDNANLRDSVYIGTDEMGHASKGHVQRPFVCAK
nr:CD209 antigen-like protein B [Nerophis lumbriciformis]